MYTWTKHIRSFIYSSPFKIKTLDTNTLTHTYVHAQIQTHAQANKTPFKHITARTHKHTYTHNPYVHIYVAHAYTATTINTWYRMMGARGECRVFDTVLWYIFCAMFSLMTDFDMCSFHSLSLLHSLSLYLSATLSLFVSAASTYSFSLPLSLSISPPPSCTHSLCFYLYPISSDKGMKDKKRRRRQRRREKEEEEEEVKE